MNRELCKKEQKWIDILLNIKFKGRDILLKQILNATVSCKRGYDFISIKFNVESKIEPYPYQVRVPIEMRAYQSSSAPILFLLHIIDGVVDELEIITADSTYLNVNNIELEKVEYEINREVLL